MRIARYLLCLALAVATLGVADEASSTVPIPKILLWDRASAWQSDTKIPSTDFGAIVFQQNNADVTGTFQGGTLKGIAVGRKLKGLITLPNGQGTHPFQVQLDNESYNTFSGHIFHLGEVKSYEFGGFYLQDPSAEKGRAQVRISTKITRLPQGHQFPPVRGPLRKSQLPTDFVCIVRVQNTGPDLIPLSLTHLEIDVKGNRYGPDGAIPVDFYDMPGVDIPTYYALSRIIKPPVGNVGVTYYQQDPGVSAPTLYQQVATVGALGSVRDQVVFGMVVHVTPDFFSLSNLYPTTYTYGLHGNVTLKSDAPNFTVTVEDETPQRWTHFDAIIDPNH